MSLRRSVSLERVLLLGGAAVVGLYAGLAAGLLSQCIRAAQIALFRSTELRVLLTEPDRAFWHAVARQLRRAPWHPELAVLALLALAGSAEFPLLARWKRMPLLDAQRLRSLGLAGSFGLLLYYPSVLLRAFNSAIHDEAGGLLSLLAHAPGWLKVLAPAAGGLAAGALVRWVSPESAGHGVAEVVSAVHGGPPLRGRVALWKSIAAGVTLGSGGSAGREGPVVHLGGAVASALARWLELSSERAALLLACGAGAGIAASFRAPLAGSLFAVEIVLGGDYSVRGFAPIVLAAVTATAAARTLVGETASLHAVGWSEGTGAELPLYLLLGIFSGLVALVYVRALALSHRIFEGQALRGLRLAALPFEVRAGLGGLLVGLLGLFAPRVLGTGLETMNAALAGQLAWRALAVALAFKLAATALTLGSGAPGGSFFPAVFVGAMLGGLFGRAAHALLPGVVLVPQAYASVGMGAVVAGATVAPLTGVLMILELTHDDSVVLPLLLACGVAAAGVHGVLGGSLYGPASRLPADVEDDLPRRRLDSRGDAV